MDETKYQCEHRDCERGKKCGHYNPHNHNDYCKYPCPKNGAVCVPVKEEKKP